MPQHVPTSELGRALRSRHVTMIALGGVIGAGLFVGAGGAIHLGGPGVFLVYGGCGLLVLLIMRMLGEMATAQPGRGSFAEYAALALGPWAGFVIRWLYSYMVVFAVGAETVAGAKLLHQAGLPGPIWGIALGLVVLLTLINLISVQAYGELEFWFALVKVVAILVFIAVGVAFIAVLGPGQHHALLTMRAHGGMLPRGLGGLLAAVPVVFYSMTGGEIATIAAAESADPAANVSKAVRSVGLRIVLFYVGSVMVIIALVPWDELVVGLSPFKAALDAIGVPGSSQMMSVIVITAVLSCMNSSIYIGSRMLHEIGRRGDGPRFLQHTARNKTPMIGVLIGGAAGLVAAFGQLFIQQDVFTLLASSTGALGLFVYMLIAFAQIRQRRRLEAAAVPMPLKMWMFPWLSYAVIVAMGGVLVMLALVPEQRIALTLSALTMLLVFGALWMRRGRKTPATANIRNDPGQSGGSKGGLRG
jgi:GABA permease